MKLSTKRKFFNIIIVVFIWIFIFLANKFNFSFLVGLQSTMFEKTISSLMAFFIVLFFYWLAFNILYALSGCYISELIGYKFEEKFEHKVIDIWIASVFIMLILFTGNLFYSYKKLNQCWIKTVESFSYLANLPSYKIDEFVRNCQIKKDNQNKDFYSTIEKYCPFTDVEKQNATIEDLKHICYKRIQQDNFSIIEKTNNEEIIERVIESEKKFLREMKDY